MDAVEMDRKRMDGWMDLLVLASILEKK